MLNKLQTIIVAPIDSFSGYGTHSRAFVKALLKAKGNEWDIKILPTRWGNTPPGALDKNDPEDQKILSIFTFPEQIRTQPDIWITISVCDEFMPQGRVNIGYSAMVETDLVPGDMIEGMNRMDFNLVTSEFSKFVAGKDTYEKRDPNNPQMQPYQFKLNKPVEVLFLGLDQNRYPKLSSSNFDLSMIKEDFCFLSVGHFLPGTEALADRKMMGKTIKTFLETFKNKKSKPALILKASKGTYSYMDQEETLKTIDIIRKTVDSTDLPNIYLIHGELSDLEMCNLYVHDKVKAFVLVGNEGFGLPYLEFSAVSSKPIICSGFSGHVDFLNQDYCTFVKGILENVHESCINKFILKESRWFSPDEKHLKEIFEDYFKNYKKYVDGGKRQGHICRTQFNIDAMAKRLTEILDKHMPKISATVPFVMPSKASISLPKLKKAEPQHEYLEELK